jgi:hypothetical protein
MNKVKTVLLGCRTPKMQHTNPRFKERVYLQMITNLSSDWAFQKRTSVVESDSFSRPDIGH